MNIQTAKTHPDSILVKITIEGWLEFPSIAATVRHMLDIEDTCFTMAWAVRGDTATNCNCELQLAIEAAERDAALTRSHEAWEGRGSLFL